MTLRTLSLALLLLPAQALAVDLNQLIVGWTNTTSGQDGSDGVDEANDVVITAANEIVVVGYLDGAANHGRDAFAINYETDGTSNWDFTYDTGDDTSSTVPGSDDRLTSIVLEPSIGAMAWCGTRGVDGSTTDADVETWSYVARHNVLVPNSSTPPTLDFEQYARDGSGLNSPHNACTGLEYVNDLITSTGWSTLASFGGRWTTRSYDDSTGFLDGAPLYFSDQTNTAVPDQAYAVARNPSNDHLAVVGTRGFSGTQGSNANNTDWYVRVYDASNALLWEHVYQGDANMEDQALAVGFDPNPGRDRLVVAGFTNAGTNNTTASDRNWLVISYNALGDGVGGPSIIESVQFGGSSNADEIATTLTFDEDDNLLVGGTTRDAASGNEVWRLAKLAPSLDTTQEWLGADHGGDSAMNAVAYLNDRVVMAGTVDDGTGADFGVVMLERDGDGDGVSDSVDECPTDPTKIVPGVCDCNNPDDDFDKDGTANCIDECPTDPNKQDRGVCPCEAADVDSDSDSVLDCNDECPSDPAKSRLGECGCGAPDVDEDGDGILKCYDACLDTPKNAEIDEFGCSEFIRDTGDPTDGPTDGSTDDGGTGCNTALTGLAPIGVLLPLFGLLAVRRRSQHA